MVTSEQIIIRFKILWSSILYWKEKFDLHLLTAIHFKQTRQPLQVIYSDRNESWLHDRIQIQTFQGEHNKMKSSFAFGAAYTIQRWRFLETKSKHSDETRIAIIEEHSWAASSFNIRNRWMFVVALHPQHQWCQEGICHHQQARTKQSVCISWH